VRDFDDAGARVVITTDGAYRNAQVVGFKEPYTDRALDDYVPLGVALQIVEAISEHSQRAHLEALTGSVS